MNLFEIIQEYIILDFADPEYLIALPLENNLEAITDPPRLPTDHQTIVAVYKIMGSRRLGGRMRYGYKFSGIRII